jgi:hypothetical protein
MLGAFIERRLTHRRREFRAMHDWPH